MLEVVQTEQLTAKQFLELPKQEVKTARYVRKKLGHGFGFFEVTYTTPKLKEVASSERNFTNFATRF